MGRKVLLMLAVIAALAFAAGCGTTTSDDNPVTPSGETPAAEATAEVASMGDTLAIASMETDLEITLKDSKRVKAVKLYGSEMSPAAYGVKLTIKNVGDTLYDDSVSNCCVLIDSKDQSHNVYFGMVEKSGNPVSGVLEGIKISPGDKRSGWVFFDMTAKQKPRQLQFTADSGFGPEVGEWTLD